MSNTNSSIEPSLSLSSVNDLVDEYLQIGLLTHADEDISSLDLPVGSDETKVVLVKPSDLDVDYPWLEDEGGNTIGKIVGALLLLGYRPATMWELVSYIPRWNKKYTVVALGSFERLQCAAGDSVITGYIKSEGDRRELIFDIAGYGWTHPVRFLAVRK